MDKRARINTAMLFSDVQNSLLLILLHFNHAELCSTLLCSALLCSALKIMFSPLLVCQAYNLKTSARTYIRYCFSTVHWLNKL